MIAQPTGFGRASELCLLLFFSFNGSQTKLIHIMAKSTCPFCVSALLVPFQLLELLPACCKSCLSSGTIDGHEACSSLCKLPSTTITCTAADNLKCAVPPDCTTGATPTVGPAPGCCASCKRATCDALQPGAARELPAPLCSGYVSPDSHAPAVLYTRCDAC